MAKNNCEIMKKQQVKPKVGSVNVLVMIFVVASKMISLPKQFGTFLVNWLIRKLKIILFLRHTLPSL